jgi:hypothetical protein
VIFLSSGGILSAILAIDNNLNSVVLEWAEESVVFSRSVILILFFGDLASRISLLSSARSVCSCWRSFSLKRA